MATQEQLQLELDQLNDEFHDDESQLAIHSEEQHSRDSAEERLVALRDRHAADQKTRSDLAVVVADLENRARDRSDLEPVYADIRGFETVANDSNIKSVWETTVANETLDALFNVAPADGATAVDLGDRLAKVKKVHDAETQRVSALQAAAAAGSTQVEAEMQKTLAMFQQEYRAELARLDSIRTKARTALNEQRFHLKRGTHLKGRTVSRRAKDEYLELEQAKAEHDKVCESINEEEFQLNVARRELEELKREQKHLLRTSSTEKASLLTNVENLKKEVESVDWEQRTLTEENTSLRDMRRDMIRTQAQVRTQLKA